jgi:UDP-glucuronate 4-epimerase
MSLQNSQLPTYNNKPRVLVTGAAGFIGMHTVLKLLKDGYSVVGVDNLNDYYDVQLKRDRLYNCGIPKVEIKYGEPIDNGDNYRFCFLNLQDDEAISRLFAVEKINYVIALGAQAGVRYSLEKPFSYLESNVTGFLTILEGCRNFPVNHIIYASTSSVYGLNRTMPFAPNHSANHPISLYAATKKANEMMAHSYSHLFGIPTTGLRFFTVYGPWGRPDMALFKFTKAILAGDPIEVYNEGKMIRDFTYVDDIVENIFRIMTLPSTENVGWDALNPLPDSSSAPYRILNIGNNQPVMLMEYIHAIEVATGEKAICNFLPMQLGDVPDTHADVNALEKLTNFRPATSVTEGVIKFVNWYREYYNV